MPSSKSESMEMTQSEHTKERLAGIKLPKMNAVCSTENKSYFPLPWYVPGHSVFTT